MLGHAVLHHLPDLRARVRRVPSRAGTGRPIVFAGEPSRFGDRIARSPEAVGAAARAGVARRCCTPAPPPATGSARLGGGDLATTWSTSSTSTRSRPSDLVTFSRRAGFVDVDVRGEELTASWFGWFNRVLEATADPEDVPMLWRRYAFHGYLRSSDSTSVRSSRICRRRSSTTCC